MPPPGDEEGVVDLLDSDDEADAGKQGAAGSDEQGQASYSAEQSQVRPAHSEEGERPITTCVVTELMGRAKHPTLQSSRRCANHTLMWLSVASPLEISSGLMSLRPICIDCQFFIATAYSSGLWMFADLCCFKMKQA